jgi:hypothetical protein
MDEVQTGMVRDLDSQEAGTLPAISVVVTTGSGGESPTENNPKVKVCGTSSCGGATVVCTENDSFKSLTTSGLAADSDTTVSVQNCGSGTVGTIVEPTKICFSMAAGETDNWIWTTAKVTVGDDATEYDFTPTGSQGNIAATSSQGSGEMCVERTATCVTKEEKLKDLGEAAGSSWQSSPENLSTMSVTGASCTENSGVCSGMGSPPKVKICGGTGGCTSGCSDVCTDWTVYGTQGFHNDEVREISVNVGDITSASKVCFQRQSWSGAATGWDWVSASITIGTNVASVTASSTAEFVLASVSDQTQGCASVPVPSPPSLPAPTPTPQL